jgi:hypothetical protein
MVKALITPVALFSVLVLTGCSYGPSAACLDADRQINEQVTYRDGIPKTIKELEDWAIKKYDELYEYCLTNPPSFLNNRNNFNPIFKIPDNSCSSWYMWAAGGAKAELRPDIDKLEAQKATYENTIKRLQDENKECFDETGFLKQKINF